MSMRVNRLAVLSLGIVLLFCSNHALGQHGGHGGGGRGGAPRGAGSSETSNSNLQDFNRALAVQATPDQVSQFQALAKSTEAARKQAQELLQIASKANSMANFSQQTSALKDVLEDAQGGAKYFVKGLSKSQKDGLKELTKKLEKADSEVAKHRKVLDQQVGRAKTESAAIASTADKLEKALAEFQAQQLSLGKEMGIQIPAS
jgi:hypothetical protein